MDLVFLAIVVAHNIPTLRRAKQLVGVLFLSTLVSVAYAGWQLAAGIGLRVHDLKQDSVFYRAGIRTDDVILRADNHLFRQPEKLFTYLGARTRDNPVRLFIVRDQGFDVLKDAVPVIVPAGSLPHLKSMTDWGVKLETERLERARSFYSHPVTYATVLELLGCVAFGLWLASRNLLPPAKSSALLGIWIILAFALGTTLTRSAWIAFAFGCLLLVWLRNRRRWVKVVLPALLILAAVGTNVAIHRWRGLGLIDLHDPGTQYRLQMWRDGLRLIETHPWFGVGMNTIRDTWWNFNLVAQTKYGIRSHFHSTPIQLAATQGIPALLAWSVLMGCYLIVLVRLAQQALEQRNLVVYGLALGILGGTSAFLVSSIVQYNFGDSVAVLQFWFFVGLALALKRQLQSVGGAGGDTRRDCGLRAP